MTEYWRDHQVGGPYASLGHSTVELAARSALYPDLKLLMPVTYPRKTVLDFGCGPGHDTVLFLLNEAKHVYYADVSPLALQITTERLLMHGFHSDRATALHAEDDLPVVEHVHCAGVLHHTENPLEILRRLRHALVPWGEARVMVYDGSVSQHSQSDVPITEWWTYEEFLSLADKAGFEGEHIGSYPCSSEWRPNCFAACYVLR